MDAAQTPDAAGYVRFSAGEYERRYVAVRELLAHAALDALVVFGWSAIGRAVQADVHYVSNYLGMRDNYVLFPLEGEPVLFVQGYNHVPNASRVSVLDDVRWGGPSNGETLGDELRKRNLRRVGVVGLMPYQHHEAMRRAAGEGTTFVDVTGPFRRLRTVKSEEEIAWLRRGAHYTDLALEALESELRPGLSEVDLGQIVEAAYRPHGGMTVFHYITSTTMRDPDSCVPAQVLSRRKIRAGDIVTVEISAAYEGYAGQGLRSYAVGEEPTPLFRHLHETAEQVFSELVETIKAGATTEDVLAAGDRIAADGFTIRDDLLHGFGIGLLPPSLGTRSTPHDNGEWTFSDNETVVVQPNVVTRDERAGVQTGQLCRVTQDGLESLHRYPLRLVRV
ncbi:MAG: M24 family metallopeptidase [bacterium]